MTIALAEIYMHFCMFVLPLIASSFGNQCILYVYGVGVGMWVYILVVSTS